jgi:hypothetical protein
MFSLQGYLRRKPEFSRPIMRVFPGKVLNISVIVHKTGENALKTPENPENIVHLGVIFDRTDV